MLKPEKPQTAVYRAIKMLLALDGQVRTVDVARISGAHEVTVSTIRTALLVAEAIRPMHPRER
jgi:hypothetical protein